MKISARNLIAFFFFYSIYGIAQNAITSQTLVAEPSTLKSISFRWIVTGDANNNAEVKTYYRVQGQNTWKRALDMTRVNAESVNGWTCGNLFAGSILNLNPGTTYETKFVLSDIDNITNPSDSVKYSVVTTRTEPAKIPSVVAKTRHVYTVADITTQATTAQPGDVILIHNGIYNLPSGLNLSSILSAKNTSAAQPIVFRGESTDSVILDGNHVTPGTQGSSPANFLDIRGSKFIYFENITVRNAWIGFRADGCEGLVIRNCHIYNVRIAMRGSGVTSIIDKNWFIADNIITGWNPQWYPYGSSANNLSNQAVQVYGQGNIIAYNTIGRFYDAIAVADAVPDGTINKNDPPCYANDFHNNEIYDCMDDGIEADAAFHNFRVFENRITNCHSGLSAQPVYGGPVYFFRNIVYNGATDNPFKLHVCPSGIEIFHNTVFSALRAWQIAAGWQNARIYNNLIMGDTATFMVSMDNGTPTHARTKIDYNGYTKTNNANLITWNTASCGGSTLASYANLTAFYTATGYEQHGKIVGFGIFQKTEIPGGENNTYAPDSMDYRLNCAVSNPAVDAGVILNTVNDTYTGTAPDMGAYECGQTIPQYGVRTSGTTGINATTQNIMRAVIYPNPGSGIFSVRVDNVSGYFNVEVRNSIGEIIKQETAMANADNALQLNLGNEANGLYFVTLKNESNIITTRLILSK